MCPLFICLVRTWLCATAELLSWFTKLNHANKSGFFKQIYYKFFFCDSQYSYDSATIFQAWHSSQYIVKLIIIKLITMAI